jgi:simple sugar transport system ATP-binding protein
VAGVAGNGQRELAEVLTGIRPVSEGKVLLQGRDMTHHAPDALIAAGLGYIPEDRLRMGSIASLSVRDNLILKAYRQPPLSRGVMLAFRPIRAFAEQLVRHFNVAASNVDVKISTLSGGNIQKVILAREMSAEPKIIVAAHPTRGLDIGATQAMHERLLERVRAGAAMLLISEDLDELLALSDKIAVMCRGEIVGILVADQANLDALGLMMAGRVHTESESVA